MDKLEIQGIKNSILVSAQTLIHSLLLSGMSMLVGVWLVGCGNTDMDSAKTTSPTSPTSPAIPVVGQSTFQSQCASCHGSDGEGSGNIPGLHRGFTQEELEFIITYSMPPTNPNNCIGVCASETAQYVYSTFAVSAGPIVSGPSTGASLYNAGCASCHGLDGKGTLRGPGVTRDLSIADLTTIIETRMPLANPSACVGSCASLIAEYIYSTFAIPSDQTPTIPPGDTIGATAYSTYCVDCHGVDGLGVGAIIGLTRDISVNELTTIIETRMPIQNPSECTGTCASETALYVYNNFRVPNTAPTPVDPSGATIYVETCAACHGLDGRGSLIAPGVTRYMTTAELATIIATSMPPTNPASCVGDCALNVAQYIFDNFTLPETTLPPNPTPTNPTGEELYSSIGCAGCHGLNGQGTAGIIGVTRDLTLEKLTDIISVSMPPTDPSLCVGSCAASIAEFILNTFTIKSNADTNNPLGSLPTGQVQTAISCARMEQNGDDNSVRDLFCGSQPASITSLAALQSGLGLEFVSPNATGRRNNGRQGNPNFAITGHSSSLVGKFVNAINPRAIIFSDTGPGFVASGFTRGDQFVEVVVQDRNRNRLSFFLVAFEQACNAAKSCGFGDLLTPAIETNWTQVTLYNEEDLKNTTADCRQCHQINGPGSEKILRMQELRDPWNHWFRDNRSGGATLLSDFKAAHGSNEAYAGIPAQLIDASDPAKLEDFLVNNGFSNQPNEFNSARIEAQVNQTPGQPANNDIPGTSSVWNLLYQRANQGLAIPPPYHDVKVTDSNKLTALTDAYQNFINGNLASAELPDLRNAFLESRLYEIGFAVDPSFGAQEILLQACSQCHNSNLDQTITRSRFNVNLNAMSDTRGGLLSGVARDLEIGVAIDRLQHAPDSILIMPPAYWFRELSPAQITTVVNYLCSQANTPIAQCQ